MTSEERERLDELRKAAIRRPDGSYLLPDTLAPHGRELQRLEDLVGRLEGQLAASPREQLHDRVHLFLMGFIRLKSADGALVEGLLANFLDAIEGQSLHVVDTACARWNQRKFTWANYSHPPDPPEFRRAVDEVRAALRVRQHDLRIVIGARPAAAAALPAPRRETMTPDAVKASDKEAGAFVQEVLAEARSQRPRLPPNEVMMAEVRAERRAAAEAELEQLQQPPEARA